MRRDDPPIPRRPSLAPSARASLDPLLGQVWERGRAAWPELAIPRGALLRHLSNVLPPEASEESLQHLRASDLFLCCGCILELPAAIAALEALLPAVGASLRTVLPHPTDREEVMRHVRFVLLARPGGRPPKLAEYAGRGDLRGWIRVIALRVAEERRRGVPTRRGA